MMYSEFLEISGRPEKYISFVEYTSLIEPIYMESELSKKDFIAVMNEGFDKIVNPAVEKAIRDLPMEDKLRMAYDDAPEIMEQIAKVDFQARLVAYEYLRLMVNI